MLVCVPKLYGVSSSIDSVLRFILHFVVVVGLGLSKVVGHRRDFIFISISIFTSFDYNSE